ncbi:zinc transporter foi isoform X2 [Photinus pyralis]|uniref:zinc transporter foi isoform X2 n=1 Tax=Photinus pyralis TaxID=7054 RepID=UPI001267667D|nr:zinc transporter foi isoform X2 [Photinus pyralis]
MSDLRCLSMRMPRVLIMAKHFISVCVVCILCATHFPCESHAEVMHANSTNHKSDVPFAESDLPPDDRTNGPPTKNSSRDQSQRSGDDVTDNSITNDKSQYIRKIFSIYGDGNTITMQGFEQLLNHFDLVAQSLHGKTNPTLSFNNIANLISYETENTTDNNNNNNTCIKRKSIIDTVFPSKDTSNNTLNYSLDSKLFEKVCPVVIYSMIVGMCNSETEMAHVHMVESRADIHYTVWLYSTVSVIVISVCGLLGLGVVPMMQNRCYKQLLQFLVALAVGTLAGDALIHLLPHAMSSNGHEHNESSHDEIMWKGFVAMFSIIFFFVVERTFNICAKWRKERHLNDKIPKMKVMKEGLQPSSTSEKQCKHKYSSIPYCYDAIAMIDKNREADGTNSHNDTSTNLFDLDSCSDIQHSTCNNHETNQNMTECPSELTASNCTEVNKMLDTEKEDANSTEYTVILREHENRHHGHSHAHGHVHAAPKDLSSVAWMVILGDGIHNFTDGMAIGAAFSGSIAGGLSTTVAVFCHELPHELGDFAMLLKAGMTTRQALFYNVLSSFLCLFGNIFGVWLGTTELASSWVFAVAAGSFIYIALVDMLPELSNSHEDEGMPYQCLLQFGGLFLGVAIMTIIAVYEHDLKHIFYET